MKQTDVNPTTYLGIDVAKEKMDVLLLVKADSDASRLRIGRPRTTNS